MLLIVISGSLSTKVKLCQRLLPLNNLPKSGHDKIDTTRKFRSVSGGISGHRSCSIKLYGRQYMKGPHYDVYKNKFSISRKFVVKSLRVVGPCCYRIYSKRGRRGHSRLIFGHSILNTTSDYGLPNRMIKSIKKLAPC